MMYIFNFLKSSKYEHKTSYRQYNTFVAQNRQNEDKSSNLSVKLVTRKLKFITLKFGSKDNQICWITSKYRQFSYTKIRKKVIKLSTLQWFGKVLLCLGGEIKSRSYINGTMRFTLKRMVSRYNFPDEVRKQSRELFLLCLNCLIGDPYFRLIFILMVKND